MASIYEFLLILVVGFAPFQMTLKKSGVKIEEFWGYYDKSVTDLRKSLADAHAHSEFTIFNDTSNQKVAYHMFLKLYSVDSSAQ